MKYPLVLFRSRGVDCGPTNSVRLGSVVGVFDGNPVPLLIRCETDSSNTFLRRSRCGLSSFGLLVSGLLNLIRPGEGY